MSTIGDRLKRLEQQATPATRWARTVVIDRLVDEPWLSDDDVQHRIEAARAEVGPSGLIIVIDCPQCRTTAAE